MKRKLLVITGTPGVGKSTLAKKIAKYLHFNRLDLHRYYKKLAIGYNYKKRCYDLDFKKLITFIENKKRKSPQGLILDSHLAHLLPRKTIDLCLVLVCSNLKELRTRLQKRKYSQQKIRENLDAEIFQVCLIEAKERRHKVMIIDTSVALPWKQLYRKISKSL